ncbi:MAG: sugar transferase, partial [Thermoleophilia bacterium]
MPDPSPTVPGPVGGRAKRATDLALAVPLAVATAPVMAVIAVWVRRDSPGPALYRQRRVGYAGAPFTLLKFRTMVVGAEGMGAGLAVRDGDDRITRAGRLLRRLSL